MAKISINPVLLISKQCYAVKAEKVRLAAAAPATAVRKVAGETACGKQEEIFWMRDPKTGNWVPENHFGEIDVAEMREKFLSKRHNNL